MAGKEHVWVAIPRDRHGLRKARCSICKVEEYVGSNGYQSRDCPGIQDNGAASYGVTREAPRPVWAAEDFSAIGRRLRELQAADAPSADRGAEVAATARRLMERAIPQRFPGTKPDLLPIFTEKELAYGVVPEVGRPMRWKITDGRLPFLMNSRTHRPDPRNAKHVSTVRVALKHGGTRVRHVYEMPDGMSFVVQYDTDLDPVEDTDPVDVE